MNIARWTATGVAAATLVLTAAGQALALPPGGGGGGGDPVPHCPTGFHWDDLEGMCVRNAPVNPPNLAVDANRQTIARNGVQVAGWAADSDAPTTPLTVRITVDGAAAASVTANASRPDVAQVFPAFGANHGYNVTVPASSAGHTVCVTAVNVGSGTDTTSCSAMDDITEYDVSPDNVVYDSTRASITGDQLDELDYLSQTNLTTIQQSTSMAGNVTLTDTHGWSDTAGVTVNVSGGVHIPLISDFKVSVTGSYSYTQNGQQSEARGFSWNQPILVPAHSKVVASVALTRSTVTVPYTMNGSYRYRSGLLVPSPVTGTYSGISSHDMAATISQYNLDGSPAARAAAQPKGALSVHAS